MSAALISATKLSISTEKKGGWGGIIEKTKIFFLLFDYWQHVGYVSLKEPHSLLWINYATIILTLICI